MVRHYGLTNVRLIDADIYDMDNSRIEPGDIIVAAGVLDHFKDLSQPAKRLRDWLKDDLFTSGPSENFLTRLGRLAGGMEKPWDHYHTGYEVEGFFESHGFEKLHSRHVYRLLPCIFCRYGKNVARLPDAYAHNNGIPLSNPRRRNHCQCAGLILHPQTDGRSVIPGLPANRESPGVEDRAHGPKLEPLDNRRGQVPPHQINHQRGEQRTMYHQPRIPLHLRRITAVVMNAVPVERERGIPEQQHIVGMHDAFP